MKRKRRRPSHMPIMTPDDATPLDDRIPTSLTSDGPAHVSAAGCWCGPEVVQVCWQCLGKCALRVIVQSGDTDIVANLPCGVCSGRGVVAPYDGTRPTMLWHR